MGLVVLAVMGFYLLISIGVVNGAIAHARENGKSKARWGWGAALVMYLIPFWDLLPTIIAYQYNCANNAGFFVYVPVDRWKELNPGVFETLSLAHLPENSRIKRSLFDGVGPEDRKYRTADGTILIARFTPAGNKLNYVEYKKPDGESGYQLNERFRYARKGEGPDLLKLSREEYVVIDIATGEVLARQVNFHQSTKGAIWRGGEDAWKFWFQGSKGCGSEKFPNGGVHRYIDSLRTDCKPDRDAARLKNGIAVSCQ
jgi:hypothetical protein